MISKVLESQRHGDQYFYLVQWTQLGKKPSWTTREANPDLAAFLQLTTSSYQQQNNNQAEGMIDHGVVNDFFKWKNTNTVKESKEKAREKQIQKLKREGVQRYGQYIIQQLQIKRDELKEYAKTADPNDTRLDILVKNVEGVQQSKFKQICFVVTFVGRANKYVVPIKKMKKHFPNALSSYLDDVIRVHKGEEFEYIYEPMQIERPRRDTQRYDPILEKNSQDIYDSSESEESESEKSREEEKESHNAEPNQEKRETSQLQGIVLDVEEESYDAESGMREEDWDMDGGDSESDHNKE